MVTIEVSSFFSSLFYLYLLEIQKYREIFSSSKYNKRDSRPSIRFFNTSVKRRRRVVFFNFFLFLLHSKRFHLSVRAKNIIICCA